MLEMAFMEWGEKYLTGIQEVDDQHHGLFDLVNQLYQAVANGDEQQTVGKILDELIDYTVLHFQTEERLFVEYKYPKLEEHKQQHDDLTRQVLDLQEQFQEKSITISFDVLDFLHDWLKDHTTGSDLEFGRFYQQP